MRNDYRDYLMHYGVKGMKWRKHKKASTSSNTSYKDNIYYDEIIPDEIIYDKKIPDKKKYDKKISDKKTRRKRKQAKKAVKKVVSNAVHYNRPKGPKVSYSANGKHYTVQEVSPSIYDRVSQINRDVQSVVARNTGKVIQPRKRKR